MMIRALPVAVATLVGLAMGLGGFTFFYAQGASYLGHDPAACANCHVMQDQYSGWLKSSHRAVADCNDCHTPHALIPKYLVKAENGFRHSLRFTLQDFHEPIRINSRNRKVTEAACRHCHEPVVHAMVEGSDGANVSCIRCHGSVGHPAPGAMALRRSGGKESHER